MLLHVCALNVHNVMKFLSYIFIVKVLFPFNIRTSVQSSEYVSDMSEQLLDSLLMTLSLCCSN